MMCNGLTDSVSVTITQLQLQYFIQEKENEKL